MRELYRTPGIAATVKPRYYVLNYWSSPKFNPSGIVPKGTPVSYA
jgi:putative glutathione S-transferase